MATIVNSALNSMKQQLGNMARLITNFNQTYSDGNHQVARFRKTIEPMPKADIDVKTASLTQAKIQPPEVNITENLREIIEDMNEYMHSLNTTVRFGLHRRSGRYFARLVDVEKNEIVAQFPIEAMLEALAKVREVRRVDGLLIDRLPWLFLNRKA
jgi:flagellar protein FlaG